MCIHETVQMTDEHQTIYCPDCGREFGHLGRDENETFYVYVTPDHPVIAIAHPTADIGIGIATVKGQEGRIFETQPVYPCRRCGWAGTCGEEEGGCHS